MEKKKSAKKRSHVDWKQFLTPDKGTSVQRAYKDNLFRFIFRDKKKLLQLYNALRGSDYQDEDGLIIMTIENVLYLGYKNDVSFLLDDSICLYEHQGSWNPATGPATGSSFRMLRQICRFAEFSISQGCTRSMWKPRDIISMEQS